MTNNNTSTKSYLDNNNDVNKSIEINYPRKK